MVNDFSYYLVRCWGTLMFDLLHDFSVDMPVVLNKTESKAMCSVYLNEGFPMSFYSRVLSVENGSFTTIADNLEKKGLICRVAGADDKRVKVLRLTDYGRGIAQEVKRQLDIFLDEHVGRLTDEEQTRFFSALSVIEELREKIVGK